MALKHKVVLTLIAGICTGLWLRYGSFGHRIHKADETNYVISSHSLFGVDYQLLLVGRGDDRRRQFYFVQANPGLHCEDEIEAYIEDAASDMYLSGRFIDGVCLQKNGVHSDDITITPGLSSTQVNLARVRNANKLNDKRLVLIVHKFEPSFLSLLMVGLFYYFTPYATVVLLAILVQAVLSRLAKILGIRTDDQRGA
jgi:hypothetical protein